MKEKISGGKPENLIGKKINTSTPFGDEIIDRIKINSMQAGGIKIQNPGVSILPTAENGISTIGTSFLKRIYIFCDQGKMILIEKMNGDDGVNGYLEKYKQSRPDAFVEQQTILQNRGRGVLAVEGDFDNQLKMNLMIDTGAPNVEISEEDAHRLGYDCKPGESFILKQLTIGGITVENVRVVARKSAGSIQSGKGLLGLSFLDRVAFAYSYSEKSFFLMQQKSTVEAAETVQTTTTNNSRKDVS